MMKSFKVYSLSIIIVIAKMQYLSYIIFQKIWEKDIFVKTFLILHKNIRRVANTTMRIIQNGKFHLLPIKKLCKTVLYHELDVIVKHYSK